MENGRNLTSLPAALWPNFVRVKGFMGPGTWATLSLSVSTWGGESCGSSYVRKLLEHMVLPSQAEDLTKQAGHSVNHSKGSTLVTGKSPARSQGCATPALRDVKTRLK